jgi:transcriptional regulator with XRE-family HTH domain
MRDIVNNELPQQRIGPLLRQLREEAGLSVRGLATSADVDSTWLSRVEHGIYVNPDPKKLNQLAKVLGVETMELFQAAEYAEGFPGFAPYMRTKYDLPRDAVEQLQAHFNLLAEKYGVEQEVDNDEHHSTAA